MSKRARPQGFVSNEKAVDAVRKLLASDFSLSTLSYLPTYIRADDAKCSGEKALLSIAVTTDGSVLIWKSGGTVVFDSLAKGGNSPRTRRALMILAEAIRLDNLERPQK